MRVFNWKRSSPPQDGDLRRTVGTRSERAPGGTALSPSSPVIPLAHPNSPVDIYGMPTDEDFWGKILKEVDLAVSAAGWGQHASVSGLTIEVDHPPCASSDLAFHHMELPGEQIESLWGCQFPDRHLAIVAVWERAIPADGSDDPFRARILCSVTRTGYSFALVRVRVPGEPEERLFASDASQEPILQVVRRAIGAPRDDRAPSVSPWEAMVVATIVQLATLLDLSDASQEREDALHAECLARLADKVFACQRLGFISLSAEALQLLTLSIDDRSNLDDKRTRDALLVKALEEGAIRAQLDLSWSQLCTWPEGIELCGLTREFHPALSFPNWGPDALVGQALYPALSRFSDQAFRQIAEVYPSLAEHLEELADIMCATLGRVTRMHESN